jgi:hypothetical protein
MVKIECERDESWFSCVIATWRFLAPSAMMLRAS